MDASGKDTQALRLCTFLRSSGKTVCLRSHPSDDNFLGLATRRFLLSKGRSAHFASALFYMFDVIRSILLYSWQKYDNLVFVRYLMGTAYLPSPFHMVAYVFFGFWVPKSNNMFFLDITPEEAYRRISENRRMLEMFEDLSALGRVRAKALSLTSFGEWTVVNADKSVEEVEFEIRKSL